MKTLLNIETFGISLYYDEQKEFPFIEEYSDTYAPISHEVKYKQFEEVLSDIINRILIIDNIYCQEDLPDFLAKAYDLAGIKSGLEQKNPEITETVYAFLYIVLEGIASANMR